jgi:asparagine synthase (glutamine-hydrolysing)
MAHRGPDGEGVWWDARAGLAHRRLSIIDVDGGAQPMSFLGKRFHISFNGEIYNYRTLRLQLEALGHRFATRSDTEVILASYAEWGRDAPSRLRGIFAFGIWDQKERKLFLARDHFGVKPLFYARGREWICFSSEVKALLDLPEVATKPCPEGMWDYLSEGYALGPRTILADIARVPAATWLEWREGASQASAYWDAAQAFETEAASGISKTALVDEYNERLGRAVKSQLVADVPVGAFLSGGLDSSSLAYHMRGQVGPAVKTFSMGFEEASHDESVHGRRVADALGTDHHTGMARACGEDDLRGMIRLFDEPLGDSSIVPTHLLAKLARANVKVVLSGDGADECLAGYDTYIADRIGRLYSRVPQFFHEQVFARLARLVPPSPRKVSLNYKVRQFVAHASGSFEEAHFGWRTLFDEGQCGRLLHAPSFENPTLQFYRDRFARVEGHHWLNRCLYVDAQTWLIDDILTKVDRATMAVGLEARVPFLDVDLFEFSARLPIALKVRGLERKVVLRRAMKGRLPKETLQRRKSGFNSPVSEWLRGPLREMFESLLRSGSGMLDLEQPLIGSLWREHVSEVADHGFKLWALAMLLLWEREVVQRATPGEPSSLGVGERSHHA